MHSFLSQNMEEEKQAEARQSMKSTCAFALVGLKHIHSSISSSSARPATPYNNKKKKVARIQRSWRATPLLFGFFILSFVCFSATTQDILSRCDDLQSRIASLNISVNSVLTRLQNAKYTTNEQINGEYVERVYPATNIAGVGDSYHILQNYSEALVQMSSDVAMIRQYAASLDSSGGSYDDTDLMAQLETIEQNLTDLSTSVDDVKQLVMDFMGWFTENQDKITYYLDNWGNFTNSLPSSAFYHYITNRITSTSGSQRNQVNGFPFYFYNFNNGTFSKNPVFTTSWGHYNPYLNDSNSIDISKIKNFSDLFSFLHFDLIYGFSGIGNNLYTNTVDTINYHKHSLQLLKDGFSTVSNSTVRPYIDELYKSPLDEVTSDFYAHLTNSYLSAYSGTNPNTNWFRRVETLLAALVFQGSGHEEDIEEVGEAADKAQSDRTALEGTFDAENVLSFDLGQQVLDTNFHLPSMGSQFPQSLSFTVPNYVGSGSQSEDYTITIETTKIRPLCELIRACFRMLYLLFLIFVLWAVYKLFIKYLRFIFNLFSGLNP